MIRQAGTLVNVLRFGQARGPGWRKGELSSWRHRGCCRAAVLCCIGASLPAALARAEAGAEAAPERANFPFDMRLSFGVAKASFTESDYPITDFPAFTVSLSGRAGGFIGSHVRLGGEFFVGQRLAAGGFVFHEKDFFSQKQRPSSAAYAIISPLGVFVEVYPTGGDLFFGVSGAVGLMQLPSFSEAGLALMSGFGGELGFDVAHFEDGALGLCLRYTQWQGEEDPISSEHPDGLLSRELSFGARWASF